MKKIAVIPIDNRPICYSLIEDILAQDNDIELFLPKREFLGGLYTHSNIDKLYNFIQNLPKCDYLIVSLDTIAYGGLVSSRRCPETYEQIKERLLRFKEIISNKAGKIYAFSSIMRISNNNINEEEKDYWSKWGKRIFEFSFYQHKSRKEKSFNCVYNQIPQDILDDYLNTRKRNFEINKLYLDWVEDNTIDTLVYSKDDTGKYGLNVEEAEFLESQAKKRNLNALVKTGADEIPLSLITRALCDDKNVNVAPVFLNPQSVDMVSKYEDISVKECVLNQLKLAGCSVCDKADLTFLINNFESEQGDLVLGDRINTLTKPFKIPNSPYFAADINNANGADDGFIYQLINQNSDNLYGYCGYNTSANSIGCAIFCAITKYLAQKTLTYNKNAFKKLAFIRLLDDWAYQAHIRKYVRESAPEFDLALEQKLEDLEKYEEKAAQYLNFEYKNITYSLPWKRSFEVEINVENI